MSITPIPIPGPRPEDLLAIGFVKRWHNKPTTQQQTLADHLGKVALYADWLGLHLREVYDDLAIVETLEWALTHDLPETEHGDIPNPAKKWLNKSLGQSYDDLVSVTWWSDRKASGAPVVGQLAQDLVAIADILEAATWFWTFGLDQDIKTTLIFDTFKVCRQRIPKLVPAVSDFLAAAGVPAALVGEAAA